LEFSNAATSVGCDDVLQFDKIPAFVEFTALFLIFTPACEAGSFGASYGATFAAELTWAKCQKGGT